MTRAVGDSPSVRSPGTPDIRISVRNFGPIEHGSIGLRPMNVFVGPSNTGKTYLAVLIYAFHRVLGGFSGIPPIIVGYLLRDPPSMLETGKNVFDKLDPDSKGSRFSDLDEADRGKLQSVLTKPEFLGSDLRDQLEHSFGVETVSDLIRMPGARNEARVSLEIGESAEIPWNFHMDISASDIHTDGRIEDCDLKRISSMFEKAAEKLFEKLFSAETFPDLFENLSDFDRETRRPEAYYLPADRSGIMHSYRVIASSLVQHAVRPGAAPPSLSGVMADFVQQLIHYDDPSPHADGRPSRSPMDEIADLLERQTLGGPIRPVRPLPGGYPEFVYLPRGAERGIRLNRASSMVSELAPVVLLVRGNVREGDTLLIDEPEAHLHPAAQTEMAVVLARLARAGVRVVITTHSDWLLQEIGNLMREGALSETAGESGSRSEGALRPGDIGVWLFHREGDAEGSTIREIPFDPVEGVEPADYEDVAERLYNRSADLQDRLAEAAERGEAGA